MEKKNKEREDKKNLVSVHNSSDNMSVAGSEAVRTAMEASYESVDCLVPSPTAEIGAPVFTLRDLGLEFREK